MRTVPGAVQRGRFIPRFEHIQFISQRLVFFGRTPPATGDEHSATGNERTAAGAERTAGTPGYRVAAIYECYVSGQRYSSGRYQQHGCA